MRSIERILPWAVRRQVGRLRDLERQVKNLETVVNLVLSDKLDSVQMEQAFNSQEHRKRIFREIVESIPFGAVVETGTYLGNTTAYMRSVSQLPVFSCEIDPRFHGCAQRRLSKESGISLRNCDSTELLRALSQTPLAGKTLFFYLDAHWYSNLPLGQELKIIASVWSNFVVMIDDFKVPWDAGYGFDVYGGRPLDTSMIDDVIRTGALAVFFPGLPSDQETGQTRGCAVLASSGYVADSLGSVGSLKANIQTQKQAPA